jgi:hypothetical protein
MFKRIKYSKATNNREFYFSEPAATLPHKAIIIEITAITKRIEIKKPAT